MTIPFRQSFVNKMALYWVLKDGHEAMVDEKIPKEEGTPQAK